LSLEHLPIWRDIGLDKLAVRTLVEKELGLLLEGAGGMASNLSLTVLGAPWTVMRKSTS
jgi:hypothetical protein